jgi:hypothetical protein
MLLWTCSLAFIVSIGCNINLEVIPEIELAVTTLLKDNSSDIILFDKIQPIISLLYSAKTLTMLPDQWVRFINASFPDLPKIKSFEDLCDGVHLYKMLCLV